VRVDYFQEPGLQVFLDKIQAQGWLALFTNTQRGCSIPDLVEFYANYEVTNRVATSMVNGKHLSFTAQELGEILVISS